MRERENAQFLYCRNCDSLAVVAVAHFDPYLAGRHLGAIGSADDCFRHLHLWVVINILQNKVQFDPRSRKKLFVHYLYLRTLVNVNIAFSFLQSEHSVQVSLINNKRYLIRLLLAAGGELIISKLNQYR